MNDKHPDLIFAYTRAEAIADGVLHDASLAAKEAGFRYPVAVTSAVWHDYVSVPAAVPWQDETGRLWDILSVLRAAIQSAGHTDIVHFSVCVQNQPDAPETIRLKALCGPGDDAEPVITIMFPHED
jgi:hypothetical protein